MKYKIMNWALKAIVLGLALGCGVSFSMAGEDRPSPNAVGGETAMPAPEDLPVYFETEGDFSLGYRWVSREDSLKAAEYIYPHSSVTFGLNLLSCPLPYRYHVNAEFLGKHDFYTDAGFAYKDLILFRDILVGVHHDLAQINYQFAGEPPELLFTPRNAASYYYLNFISNLMLLRLKAPDFPFHAFINHRHVERDGRIQQRFLLGYFGELNKVSESRDIDWKSNAIKIGANSHLGPVEIEYTYDQAEFDPGRNNVLYDSYPEFTGPPFRPEDTYPHNVVPETESSAHSVKLHSSYTGSIVAAATFSNLSQKNNYSLAESTTWRGVFDFSWIPDPAIGLFFKYRHKDVDMDYPSEATLTGLNNTINYSVREGISYDKDVFSLSGRYKPLHLLTLYANYEFSNLERKEVAEWDVLPPKTRIHTIDLRAHAKPLDQVAVKAIYEYKNYDQPAYNTTPDKSNKLKLTTNYTPSPSLNVYMEYILSLSERDSLRYLNSEPFVLLETGDRDGRHEQFLASLTTGLTPRLSLTVSWFYQIWKIEQDLAYGKWSDINIGQGDYPYTDLAVPYTDRANSFSLSLHFIPRDDFTVTADLIHTISKGTAGYNDVVGGAPFSLSSFSNVEISETICSLDMTKKLSINWEAGLRSFLGFYNDKISNLQDGEVFGTNLSLKRYF